MQLWPTVSPSQCNLCYQCIIFVINALSLCYQCILFVSSLSYLSYQCVLSFSPMFYLCVINVVSLLRNGWQADFGNDCKIENSHHQLCQLDSEFLLRIKEMQPKDKRALSLFLPVRTVPIQPGCEIFLRSKL